MERLVVDTGGGRITASIGGDKDYPAIDIYINGVRAAIVEWSENDQNFFIRSFDYSNDEDTTIWYNRSGR